MSHLGASRLNLLGASRLIIATTFPTGCRAFSLVIHLVLNISSCLAFDLLGSLTYPFSRSRITMVSIGSLWLLFCMESVWFLWCLTIALSLSNLLTRLVLAYLVSYSLVLPLGVLYPSIALCFLYEVRQDRAFYLVSTRIVSVAMVSLFCFLLTPRIGTRGSIAARIVLHLSLFHSSIGFSVSLPVGRVSSACPEYSLSSP